MNNVNIIGNLTRDIEMKYTTAGKAVANISIAVNRSYTKNEEKVTEVSYFDVQVWGATAEKCQQFLHKGSKVAVTGELKQERWEKDGQTRSRVKIIARNVEFLTPKGDGGQQQQTTQQQPEQERQAVKSETESVAWTE